MIKHFYMIILFLFLMNFLLFAINNALSQIIFIDLIHFLLNSLGFLFFSIEFLQIPISLDVESVIFLDQSL